MRSPSCVGIARQAIPKLLRILFRGSAQYMLNAPTALSWARQTAAHALKKEIDDGGDVQCKELGSQEPADDGNAQGLPKLGSNAKPKRNGQSSHDRPDCRHHDWASAQQACAMNCPFGRFAMVAL